MLSTVPIALKKKGRKKTEDFGTVGTSVSPSVKLEIYYDFMTPDRRFSESVIQSGPSVDSEMAFLCLMKPNKASPEPAMGKFRDRGWYSPGHIHPIIVNYYWPVTYRFRVNR